MGRGLDGRDSRPAEALVVRAAVSRVGQLLAEAQPHASLLAVQLDKDVRAPARGDTLVLSGRDARGDGLGRRK